VTTLVNGVANSIRCFSFLCRTEATFDTTIVRDRLTRKQINEKPRADRGSFAQRLVNIDTDPCKSLLSRLARANTFHFNMHFSIDDDRRNTSTACVMRTFQLAPDGATAHCIMSKERRSQLSTSFLFRLEHQRNGASLFSHRSAWHVAIDSDLEAIYKQQRSRFMSLSILAVVFRSGHRVTSILSFLVRAFALRVFINEDLSFQSTETRSVRITGREHARRRLDRRVRVTSELVIDTNHLPKQDNTETDERSTHTPYPCQTELVIDSHAFPLSQCSSE
jgi:hypothetical protein